MLVRYIKSPLYVNFKFLAKAFLNLDTMNMEPFNICVNLFILLAFFLFGGNIGLPAL